MVKCNKTRYATRAKAAWALSGIRKRGNRQHSEDKKPTRAYVCEFCNGWHLTSNGQ